MNTNPGHLTEFLNGFTGTCGECALEVCFAAASGQQVSGADMVAITHEMQAHGQAGANGASTLFGLAREAERRGYKINTEWDYAEPFPHDWVSLIRQHAGVKPIVLQVAAGGTLHDVETGAHDETGVQYHFIAIINKQTDGYVANDGDNPQVTMRYQVYDLQTLVNAKICGVLVLEPNAAGEVALIPTGWKDDGVTLTAPNGVPVVKGFRDEFMKDAGLFSVLGEPLGAEYGAASIEPGNPAIGAGTRQDFQMGSLGWTQAKGVYRVWIGQDFRALAAEVAQLKQPGGPSIPPELQGILAEAANALAPFAHLASDVASLQKKLGY